MAETSEQPWRSTFRRGIFNGQSLAALVSGVYIAIRVVAGVANGSPTFKETRHDSIAQEGQLWPIFPI
jgi:hypothetical protein